MDFLLAAEAPIIETVRGTEIRFERLKLTDYTPWCAELHAQQKTRSKTLIPKDAPHVERFRMARIAEFDTPGLDEIAKLVWTPEGTERVLLLSLAKTYPSEDDRRQIIAAIPPYRATPLAVEVSALFEPKPPQVPNGKDSDPNAEAASKADAGQNETGSSTS